MLFFANRDERQPPAVRRPVARQGGQRIDAAPAVDRTTSANDKVLRLAALSAWFGHYGRLTDLRVFDLL